MILLDEVPKPTEIEHEAKPCPHCHSGGDLVVLVRRVEKYSARNRFFVKCKGCSARGPVAGCPKKAVELWNNAMRGA